MAGTAAVVANVTAAQYTADTAAAVGGVAAATMADTAAAPITNHNPDCKSSAAFDFEVPPRASAVLVSSCLSAGALVNEYTSA
jgi:hypothetical protein